jgi:hypothetical protein
MRVSGAVPESVVVAYEDGQNKPVDVNETNGLPVSDSDVQFLLLRLLNYLNAPYGYDKSLGRYRNTVVVESGTVTTVTTVTGVTTVTNLSQIDTLQGRLLVLGQNAAAWQSSVRSRIT